MVFPAPTPIWDLPPAPALTGQERFALDRDNLQTPGSTVRLNLSQLSSAINTWLGVATKAPLLTEQVVVTASRDLTDADAGKILICDTSQGAITLTAPASLVANWNVRVLREGAGGVVVEGSGGQTLVGPAASGGSVTLATDRAGALLVRRTSSQVWAYSTESNGGGSSASIQDVAGTTSVETERTPGDATIRMRIAGVDVDTLTAHTRDTAMTTPAGRLVQTLIADATSWGSGRVGLIMSPNAPVPVFPTPGAGTDTLLLRVDGDSSALGGPQHGSLDLAMSCDFAATSRIRHGRGVGGAGRFGAELYAGPFNNGASVLADANGTVQITGDTYLPTVLSTADSVLAGGERLVGIGSDGKLKRVTLAVAPATLPSASAFTAADYYEGGVGELRGETGGFAIQAVFCFTTLPTGWTTLVSNLDPSNPASGGYALGLTPDGITFAIAQGDGTPQFFTPTGPALWTNFRGGRLHRWHQATLVYEAGTATLLVDGEVVGTMALAGGYALADAARAARIGRFGDLADPRVGDVLIHAVVYHASGLPLLSHQFTQLQIAEKRYPATDPSWFGTSIYAVAPSGDASILPDLMGANSPMVRPSPQGQYLWPNVW